MTTTQATSKTTMVRAQGMARRQMGTPFLVVMVLGGLTIWLKSRSLDSIERQSINLSYLLTKTTQHIELTVLSTIIVLLVAIPGGVVLSRPRAKRFAPLALAVANVGQAAPPIAVVILAAMVFSVGVTVSVFALAVYAILPVLRNTLIGLQQVDSAIMDAGRGMGLSPRQVLVRIELPLAVPIIFAGLRTALVLNVGTATMAAFVSAGGLGELIVSGVSLQRTTVLVTGSVLVALLAVLIDWLMGIVQGALPGQTNPDVHAPSNSDQNK